ncbi:MAG: sulfatase [Rikenellaceae bacterium]
MKCQYLLLSTLPFAYSAEALAQTTQEQPQNMIWVFGDQHRAQALGYMGDPNANTPNLDALAQESITFTNAFSGCPWSTPFRGSLFTGLYPNKAVYRTPQKLDPTLPMVSDAFNEHGYITALYGKWHLNGHNKKTFVPKDERGRFDIWLAYENNNAQYDVHLHGHDIWGREDDNALAEKLEGYETDALTDKVIEFLRNRPKDKPFFIVLSVQPPHDPYIAPAEYMEKYSADSIILRINVPPIKRLEDDARRELAGYYAQIENLDMNVGRLYSALEELGLLETTNLAFFSDHGDCHYSHGYTRKSSPWQESVNIPFIFRPAGGRAEGVAAQSDVMFQTVDIAPTSLGMCGIETPEYMMGFDFSQVLTDGVVVEGVPDAVLLQHIYPKDFRCLDRPWRGLVTSDGWKYVVVENQPIMMFDLNEDPYELNNVVYLAPYREKRAVLAAKLQEMLDKVGDEFVVTQ